jgi:hypothetical protein
MSDPSNKKLREHFQRAMNSSLYDRIAIEPTPPTNLWSWFDITLKHDLTWRTHKSRKELFGKKPPDRKTLAGRSISIRSTIAPPPSTTIAKLTPKEREYLIKNNGCFKCRKLGHFSSECTTPRSAPKKPDGPSNPGEFKRKPNKPIKKYTPTAIRALVADLKETEYEEFLNLMDRPVSPSGSLSDTEKPVPDPSFH